MMMKPDVRDSWRQVDARLYLQSRCFRLNGHPVVVVDDNGRLLTPALLVTVPDESLIARFADANLTYGDYKLEIHVEVDGRRRNLELDPIQPPALYHGMCALYHAPVCGIADSDA